MINPPIKEGETLRTTQCPYMLFITTTYGDTSWRVNGGTRAAFMRAK